MKRILTAFFIITTSTVALSACNHAKVIETALAPAAVEIRKSPNDLREYRYLVLDNKMRVVLIADATTEKSAAALAVYRGSFHEPKGRAGLAHFLEHMLFIQTEAYPEIDGFQHYISANGGSYNAYTALDHTNYFFNTQPSALPEAIDRFAQFFISPIISEEYSLREKNAVHSEYQMQLKDDGWRGYMVGKQAINPLHPGSKFTIGSLDTLAGDIHEDLIEFFQSQYSADQMGLVVISDMSLDEMQAMITPLFSQIKNKDIGPDYPNIAMYTDAELPAKLEIQAQKEGASVSYSFPLPSVRTLYKTKPQNYFSNLFGHEGEGSLHKLLTSYGWIEGLSASVGDFDRNMSGLTISMELTPLGADKINLITDLVFQYVDLLKATPAQNWLYKEQAKVAELGFRFQEKSSPMGLVYQLAPRIDEFPPADLLIAPYLMDALDPTAVADLLAYVNETNVLIEIVSSEIEGDQREPWFDVPYTLTRKPIERRANPTHALSLPKVNPFLPDNLELTTNDSVPIANFINEPGLEIWLDTDPSFGSPRANLYLELSVANGFVSQRDRSMAQLYRLLVQDSLREMTYPAYLAGLGYSISVPDSGFEVHIGGYQDKQPGLLSTVLDALLNTELRPDRFATLKAQLIKDWNNATKDRPYAQAFAAVSDTLRSGRWPRTLLAETLTPVSLSELSAWRDEKLAGLGVRGMIHGNVSAADAEMLVKRLKNELPLADNAFIRPHVSDVEGTLRKAIDVDHNDASMVLHVQDADDSLASRAKSSLAAQLLRPAYFLDLRTEQQLGYVVSVSNRPVAKRGGLSFIIQSPTMSAAGLEAATLTFINNYNTAWPDITEAEFAQQKSGLISKLLEKPKNLNERSQMYWADLTDEFYSFDSREQLATLVEKIDHKEMGRFFQSVQDKLESNRLIIYTKGKFDDVPAKGRLLSATDNLVEVTL